jgi:hypothetical protein
MNSASWQAFAFFKQAYSVCTISIKCDFALIFLRSSFLFLLDALHRDAESALICEKPSPKSLLFF